MLRATVLRQAVPGAGLHSTPQSAARQL